MNNLLKNKLTILLIEDDAKLSLIEELILTDEGYNVVKAATGERGLEIITDQQIDLVILDLMLPDTSGQTLLAKIRRLRPEIKVIIMTGHEDVDSYIETIQRGAIDYMIKPVAPAALISVLKKVLEIGKHEVKIETA